MSQSFSPFKILLIVIVFLVLLNLAYIDVLTFLEPKSDIDKTSVVQKSVQEENNVCPQSCVSQIYEATASYKLAATTPAVITKETKAPARVKEFFIPFGSGSGSASDWQDIEGLQAYIDSTNYEEVKTVTFEASLRIPTGNQTAYVRLFNKTGVIRWGMPL